MNGAWFAVQLAAVAAGSGVALLVIRRWVAPLLPAASADRIQAIGLAARIAAASGVIPLAAGLILMWRWPYDAAADFAAASASLTLAGWFTGRRRRAVRDSAGHEPAPTDHD